MMSAVNGMGAASHYTRGAWRGCAILDWSADRSRNAVDVCDLDAAEALSADGCDLELALRAEVDAGVEFGGAVWTARHDGLTQREAERLLRDRRALTTAMSIGKRGRRVAALDVTAGWAANEQDVAGESCSCRVGEDDTWPGNEPGRTMRRKRAIEDIYDCAGRP